MATGINRLARGLIASLWAVGRTLGAVYNALEVAQCGGKNPYMCSSAGPVSGRHWTGFGEAQAHYRKRRLHMFDDSRQL
jgi:hypothetical protein